MTNTYEITGPNGLVGGQNLCKRFREVGGIIGIKDNIKGYGPPESRKPSKARESRDFRLWRNVEVRRYNLAPREWERAACLRKGTQTPWSALDCLNSMIMDHRPPAISSSSSPSGLLIRILDKQWVRLRKYSFEVSTCPEQHTYAPSNQFSPPEGSRNDGGSSSSRRH